jgi:hypothetical protein
MASAQAPGQEHSGAASQAQSQRHEGSTGQQTKEQAGQGRHEQGATQQGRHEQGAQNMPGKSGTAAQAQQRNEGKREQTTGQNLQKQTTGQNLQKGNEHAGSRAEHNREGMTNGQTGQAASEPQHKEGLHKQGQQQLPQGNQGRSGQQAQQRNLSPQQGQATSGSSGQSGKLGSNATGEQGTRAGKATVTLNQTQRSQIEKTVLARSDVPRVEHANFALTVGTAVPESVRVVAVPEELITIEPAWREDMYFVSGDDIIIVDHSRRIVAVVATGPTTAMNSGEYNSYASTRGASVNMSADEIRQLQIALNEKGFNVGSADGVFGSRTREALMAFQKKEGFQANGQPDQQTMTALGVSGNASGNAGTSGNAGKSGTTTGSGGSSSAIPNGSSMSGQKGTGLPSSSTTGQGGRTGTNMPSHTQGTGGTNLPSGQSR